MFGLFGRFGRARELRQLDDELRTAGLHPALVTDAVKLTIIRLLKAAHGDAAPNFPNAAPLVAYCAIGPGPFGDANGSDAAEAIERQMHRAVAEENSLDAQIVLLTMHAGLIQPDVVERFELKIDS